MATEEMRGEGNGMVARGWEDYLIDGSGTVFGGERKNLSHLQVPSQKNVPNPNCSSLPYPSPSTSGHQIKQSFGKKNEKTTKKGIEEIIN